MIKVKIAKEHGKFAVAESEIHGDVNDLYEELVGMTAATFCTILHRARHEAPNPLEAEKVFDEFSGNVRHAIGQLLKHKGKEAGRHVQ